MGKAIGNTNRIFAAILTLCAVLFMVAGVAASKNSMFDHAANKFLNWFHSQKAETVDISTLTERPGSRANIDSISVVRGAFLDIRGWAVMEGEKSLYKHARFLLVSEEKALSYETDTYIRQDVTAAIGDGVDHDNAGFGVFLNASILDPGIYQMWVYLKTGETICNANCQLEISIADDGSRRIFWQ